MINNNSDVANIEYTIKRTPGSPLRVYNSDDIMVAEIREHGQPFKESDLDLWTADAGAHAACCAFRDSRPEYLVLSTCALEYKLDELIKSQPTDTFVHDLRSLYTGVLCGCLYLRAKASARDKYDEAAAATRAHDIIAWLDTTDFFSAPASTKYHESFSGGLALHSLRVACNIIKLAEVSTFHNVELHSAVLCALIHDWCKINKYEEFQRNVKNDTTGKWESVTSFRYRDNIMIPLGHGEASMFLGMKMFKLTLEEVLAIRHHMGAWAEQGSYNINDLQYANENYPLVLLLQFADQLACVKY